MKTRTKVKLVFQTIGIIVAALIAASVISALYGPLAPFAFVACIIYGVLIAIWNVERVRDKGCYVEFDVHSREEEVRS